MAPNWRTIIVGLALSVFTSTAIGQQKGAVECKATLIEYQARYRWTEQEENGEVMFIAPFATFLIEAPKEFEGRTVRVLFLTSEHNQILPKSAEDLGGQYELELPADYFDGRDGLIVRDDSILSIERSANLD